MDDRLTWRWATKQIRIDTETRTLDASDSRCAPETRSFSLAAAFADARMLFIDRPEILAEVLRALSALLVDHALDTRGRQRRAFWQAFGATPSLHLAWTYPRSTAQPAEPVTLDVSGVSALCTAPPPDSSAERVWQSIDDLFFYGPLEPGIPAAVRRELVATILSALAPHSGLDASHAFPEIDHALIAPASWSWNVKDDGESGASIGGPSVIVGYQYGHDYGWGAYSVERVLTDAPELSFDAPAETWAAIVEALRLAMKP